MKTKLAPAGATPKPTASTSRKQKTKQKEKWAEANDGLMAVFAKFVACRAASALPYPTEAQTLVATLQAHVTANYSPCTNEILAGLGQMYVCDERFKKNIDKYGGEPLSLQPKQLRYIVKYTNEKDGKE